MVRMENWGSISAKSKTIEIDKNEGSQRCSGEYTLNDFLSKFELPQFVTIVDGHYTENSYGEIELSCGQQLTIHAVNKTGTIAAKTCTVKIKEQDVYLSTNCSQLVELRPNGTKDLLDDRQYSLQEIVDHFQFPILVQFMEVPRENAVAKLCTEVLRLERVIREEMVVCSIMQNDETFLNVFPRNLDISVSLAQGMRAEKVPKGININKLENTYEDLQLDKVGNYMGLKSLIQPYRSTSAESIAMKNAPTTLLSKTIIHSASILQTEGDGDNQDSTYSYIDMAECSSAFTSAQSLKDISEMSIGEVAAFLISHNLGEFARKFKQEDIDGTLLKDLDEESLKVLGLNAFQAKKLLKLINGWKPKF